MPATIGRVARPGCSLGAWRQWAAAALVLILPVTPRADEDKAEEEAPVQRLIITVTAADLYLCGEGHGGLYGCIDEARSRNMDTVRIRASNAATTDAVQALLREVHGNGFVVELDTFYE